MYIPKPQAIAKPLIAWPKKDEATGWTSWSKRTGLLLIKVGMTHDWNEWGIKVPLTVLHLKELVAVAQKTREKHGYTALQLGVLDAKVKNVTKPLRGEFAKANVTPKKVLQEFHCTHNALVPPGTTFHVQHFQAGQRVDVCSKTIGKGTQGVMKRWGFGGQPASHGTSKTHRSLGATGARQDPGKVWKGKKMPGKMGNKRRTIQNLLVFEVDVKNQCVMVLGHVPGKKHNVVRVTDAHGFRFQYPPPFPTFTPAQQARYVTPSMIPYMPEGEVAPTSYYARFNRPWNAELEGAAPDQLKPDLFERLRLARIETAERVARETAEREERQRKKMLLS